MSVYVGLGSITGPMSRVTSRGGFVVVSGKRRGGGGRRKVRRYDRRRPSRWYRLYAEV